MKLSNETKVGFLAIVAIVVLVLGFNFLKGSQLFRKPPTLLAHFTDIGSLDKSNAVKINGLPVGTVYSIKPADKEVNTIIVELHLSRDIDVPDNSIAFIDGSVLGAAYINIAKGDSKTYLKSGDVIKTRLDKGLIGNIQSQVAPTITRVNETLDSLKIAIGGISTIFDPHTKNNLQNIIANLAVSTAYLQQMLNAQSGMLAKSLSNVNDITGNLARSNSTITNSLRNVETTTAKLSQLKLEETFGSLQAAINELKTTISGINSDKSSLGLMLHDRELYDRLNAIADRVNKAALSAEITMDDFRLHPKRYVNISLIGGKNKGQPLSSPLAKDTLSNH